MSLDLTFDPKDVPASMGLLKATYEEIKQYPVELPNGDVYQFSLVDETTMRKVAKGLQLAGGTVNWRLLDNSEVQHDGASLEALANQLEMLQIQRGLVIDIEYMNFKSTQGLTKRMLETWKQTYIGGYIP